MTDQLHKLLDGGADQRVINERVAGLIESDRKDMETILRGVADHEKRIRFIERVVNYGFGIGGAITLAVTLLEKLRP